MRFPSVVWGCSPPGLSPSPWVSPRMVPSGFILPVLIPAISFVLFFFSLVCPHHVTCFGLGPFLCVLVTGSSLLVSLLLSFSPLGVSCPFLVFFSEVSRSVFFGWDSSPHVFASLSCHHCIFPISTPSLLLCSFLPRLAVSFQMCLFLCLFLHFEFPYRVI